MPPSRQSGTLILLQQEKTFTQNGTKTLNGFMAVHVGLAATWAGWNSVFRTLGIANYGEGIWTFPKSLGVADDCTFVCMCVCADIPLSVGILDPRASPTQLNAVEFLWDPSKRASAFIQVSECPWGRPKFWGSCVVPQNSPPVGPTWALFCCRDAHLGNGVQECSSVPELLGPQS